MEVSLPRHDSTLAPPADELVELLRLDASRWTDAAHKARLGQFLTPLSIARLMASMVEAEREELRILDAGAGVGSLFAALVSELLRRPVRPKRLEVHAFEIDSALSTYLEQAFRACAEECDSAGVAFSAVHHAEEFLEAAAHSTLRRLLPDDGVGPFDVAILNPPYFKIGTDSAARRLAEKFGVPSSNIYTAFVAASVAWLDSGGELVAITPRSFCNGAYFRPFREFLLGETSLRRMHVFDSRSAAFQDDAVLQENIIYHAVKHSAAPQTVEIATSSGSGDGFETRCRVPFDQVVRHDDAERFIRVVVDSEGAPVASAIDSLSRKLADLDLCVSTGRVVDFRAAEHLRDEPARDTAPLLYPAHLDGWSVQWPRSPMKKPNAISDVAETQELLIPNERYVLVKRFTAKEERRRVVAVVYEPALIDCEKIGIENHLNYVHCHGRGLERALAFGLAAYLNSTAIDEYFRQFSGHTQVNATDLRLLGMPSREKLLLLGQAVIDRLPDQHALDRIVREQIFEEPAAPFHSTLDPIMQHIDEALDILKSLGFPRQQLNERSALTLLALLDLRPETAWAEASAPMRGITPMMEFFAEHYSKRYAPNTRETVRRQTVHQFLAAGLIVANPDQSDRPTNSGKNVYQIEPSALKLLRGYGGRTWKKRLRAYLAARETLQVRYAQDRAMSRLPVTIAGGKSLTLSPGGQNVLVKQVIEEFAPRFTPGGSLVYVGDTDAKFAHFDRAALAELGVEIDEHGKMPDVIVHHQERDWLVLVEAVTSHGPVSPKRHVELQELFGKSRAGLVFVTAFLDRKTLVAYLDDISWETEVWVAESPSHLIHFNGERFLGPYSS